MATQADVLEQIRDRLDEATSTYWTDAELYRFINEGAREVCRRGEVLQKRDTIASIASTQEYTMPTDVLRVYRVEYEDASSNVVPLEYRDFNSMDSIWWTRQKTTTGSKPYWYTMWGYPPALKIILYPAPTTGSETIRVFYYGLPTALADDGTDVAETVEVPQGWEDLVVLFAEFTAMRKDGDPRWAEAKTLFEERTKDMIEMTRRWTDQADSVQWNTGFLPGWLHSGE